MKTISVSASEAELQLATLLNEVEQSGCLVRICRNGEPIADLVPVKKKTHRLAQHPDLKNIKFYEDPMAPITIW